MNKPVVQVHTGRCHCGSIRYQATGVPVVVAHCHCADCQRLSGAGHSTGAMFARNRKAWDIMDGQLPTFELQPDWKPGGG